MAEAPSNEELQTWDGASLVVALVEQRVRPRYKAGGLRGLNQTERMLLSVFEFDNEVCNGGFSQWLFHVPGDLISITPACLTDIGAADMAAIVQRVLAVFGENGPSADDLERERQIFALPESANQILHEADMAFNRHEQDMLGRFYESARKHLSKVHL